MRAEIEAIARAWMAHQGYTEDDISVAETDKHEASGCDWCPNHMSRDCTDEDGRPRHPYWDALEEACEMARIAVDALESIGSLNAYEATGGAE
ncbi:hypothetical protein GS445_02985 [Rhodococcus hoagii]|nr:hypothetical protein [Prescottella equi]